MLVPEQSSLGSSVSYVPQSSQHAQGQQPTFEKSVKEHLTQFFDGAARDTRKKPQAIVNVPAAPRARGSQRAETDKETAMQVYAAPPTSTSGARIVLRCCCVEALTLWR